MTLLKLIESGVPRELVLNRPFLLATGIVTAIWMYVTPSYRDAHGDYQLFYYCICLLINALHSIFTYSMFVSLMSFLAKVNDKKIGGTYMTFLNTVQLQHANMGILALNYVHILLGEEKIYLFFLKLADHVRSVLRRLDHGKVLCRFALTPQRRHEYDCYCCCGGQCHESLGAQHHRDRLDRSEQVLE